MNPLHNFFIYGSKFVLFGKTRRKIHFRCRWHSIGNGDAFGINLFHAIEINRIVIYFLYVFISCHLWVLCFNISNGCIYINCIWKENVCIFVKLRWSLLIGKLFKIKMDKKNSRRLFIKQKTIFIPLIFVSNKAKTENFRMKVMVVNGLYQEEKQ